MPDDRISDRAKWARSFDRFSVAVETPACDRLNRDVAADSIVTIAERAYAHHRERIAEEA